MGVLLDFRNSIIDAIKANTVGLASGMVKAVGYEATNTLKSVTENALTTIEGIPSRLEDKLRNLPSDIAGIPAAPGLSIQDLLTSLASPIDNKDDFARTVEAFTGVHINQITGFKPTPREVDARLSEFAAGLRTQIMLEIQNCIEKYIRGIINKNLQLFELINFETYVANEIAKFRIKLKSKIQNQIETYIYDKLKIQQVALFKQRILQEIRKICPSSGFTSPTLVKRLQTDRTWEAAESDKTIQESTSTKSLELAAASQKDGSTGQEVIDIAEQAVTSLGPMAQQQALGYDDSTVHDFFNVDGSPVAA